MTRFRFRLQRVLELREQAEQARARALAEARAEADAATRAHDAVAAMRVAGADALASATRDGTRVGTMHQLQYLLGHLDVRERITQQGVVTAESLVRRAQDELRAAHVDKRALEILRERGVAANRAAEVAQDRALMDDIALTRHHAAASDTTTDGRTTHG
jgi:flagellar protein FliJ